MELIFYILLFAFIVFLNVGLFIPSLISVDEEAIGRNMRELKKYNWFKDLLQDDRYKQFIVHDKEVRKLIGKFNGKKIEEHHKQEKYRKKLQDLLQTKLNSFA